LSALIAVGLEIRAPSLTAQKNTDRIAEFFPTILSQMKWNYVSF
jgi:hypothetical protein